MSGNEDQGRSSKQPKWRQPTKSKTMNQLLEFSAVGIEMGAAVGIGVFLGLYLDKKFGTEPWLILFFTFCGLVAAFRALFRLIRRLKVLAQSDYTEKK